MPTTTVNGTSLYYDALGAGPACLVMHGGLGIDHTFFRPLLDRLASRVRLVYYDHRCNGRSGRPALDTLTMAQLAADADALAGRLDTGPVIALGMSFGGFVAQELALRHPGRVAGLVLIGTTPGQLGSAENPDDDQGPAPPAELARHMQHPPPMDEERFAAMMRGFTSYLVHQADPADRAPMLARTIYSAGAWRRSMEILAGWSSVDRLGELRVPALVVAGRHDVLSSPQQAYRIGHRLGGAEVVVFEHSGHAVMYDEPDRFFSVVEDWLDRHAKEAAEVAEDVLFKALAAAEPGEVSRFIGVMTGAVPLEDYLAPANLRRVIGLRGMAKVLLSKLSAKGRSSSAL